MKTHSTRTLSIIAAAAALALLPTGQLTAAPDADITTAPLLPSARSAVTWDSAGAFFGDKHCFVIDRDSNAGQGTFVVSSHGKDKVFIKTLKRLREKGVWMFAEADDVNGDVMHVALKLDGTEVSFGRGPSNNVNWTVTVPSHFIDKAGKGSGGGGKHDISPE